jgi:hypothetical protein
MVKIINTYKILVRKPEVKRPLGRPTHRLKDNIKMDLLRNRVWTGFKLLRLGSK